MPDDLTLLGRYEVLARACLELVRKTTPGRWVAGRVAAPLTHEVLTIAREDEPAFLVAEAETLPDAQFVAQAHEVMPELATAVLNLVARVRVERQRKGR